MAVSSMRRVLAAGLAVAATALRCDPKVDSSCALVRVYKAQEGGCSSSLPTTNDNLLEEFGLLVNSIATVGQPLGNLTDPPEPGTEEAHCLPSGTSEPRIRATFCWPDIGSDDCPPEALVTTAAGDPSSCLSIPRQDLVAVVDFDCQEQLGYCSYLRDDVVGCANFGYFAEDQCQDGGKMHDQIPFGVMADGKCRRSFNNPDLFNRVACDGENYVISLGCNATCGDCETESLKAEMEDCLPLNSVAPGALKPRDTCPIPPTPRPTYPNAPDEDDPQDPGAAGGPPSPSPSPSAAPLPAAALLPYTLAALLVGATLAHS